MKQLDRANLEEVKGGYAALGVAVGAYIWYEYCGGKEVINSLR